MTKEEAKDIFSEYHTGEVIDYDYAIELVAKYCNRKGHLDELAISRALDILYEYYCKEDKRTNNDPTGSTMKELLFDDFVEYNNGGKSLFLQLIKEDWNNEMA